MTKSEILRKEILDKVEEYYRLVHDSSGKKFVPGESGVSYGGRGFDANELKAAVGTKTDARAICENWKNHSSEIYAEIINSLIKKRG